MSEKTIQDRIRLAISESHLATMFRNNVGFDKIRKVHYGFCRGSSDLIGWSTKRITPDMVGKNVAVFTALEIKTKKGKVSKTQMNFLFQVGLAGGIAGVAKSEEEAVKIIERGVLFDV